MTKTEEIGINRKSFWDGIYKSSMPHQTGWYQDNPKISLELINSLGLTKSSKIIDIGGGDSLFVDHLVDLGFEDITVLDVSKNAIKRAKKRLGKRAKRIKWLVSDVLDFDSVESYELWHDRACLHFLTREDERDQYAAVAKKAIAGKGALIIGAFSKTGPERCSGLPIQQYTCHELYQYFSDTFEQVESIETVHITPSKTKQNYVFCHFNKFTN
ncbi:class I SAM-dependent methyltransferase [Lutimonas sp.]|uniref:class I SAM-dependent methyltransferase n=1 Tax=Lutimonas sp. TaxID=1872403 RepID=UPI003D9B91CC